MKKILKMLVLGLLSAALLCCALPSAFAAEQKDAQIYTIGLDAMGGTSSVVAVTTNLNGKLSALPAQPTLDPPQGSRRKSRDEEVYSNLFLTYRAQQKCNKLGGFCCWNEKNRFFTNGAAQKAAEDGRKSGKVEPSPCGKTKNMV